MQKRYKQVNVPAKLQGFSPGLAQEIVIAPLKAVATGVPAAKSEVQLEMTLLSISVAHILAATG